MHAPIRLPAPVMSAHWPSKAKEDLLDEFTIFSYLYLRWRLLALMPRVFIEKAFLGLIG